MKNYLLFILIFRRAYRNLARYFIYVKAQNYSRHSLLFMKEEGPREILSRSTLLNSESLVLDVGGDVGIWSNQVYGKYQPRLLVFEPNPESLVELEKNLAGKKATILPYGLGGTNERIELSIRGMGSSIFSDSPDYAGSKKIIIELKDVKEAFDDLDIRSVDLIKINIEGGEYELLQRMIDTSVISLCRIVRIQFHEWFTNAYALRNRIRAQLKKTHAVEWDYPFIWESWIRRDLITAKKIK